MLPTQRPLSLNEGILSIANFMPDFPASTTKCEMETKEALISFALHTLIYILYHIIFVTAQYCKKHLQRKELFPHTESRGNAFHLSLAPFHPLNCCK